MSTSTIRLHRVLRAPPERIYRAFLDPDALARWLPPNGFTGKVHQLDAPVGGTYKMSFTNFSSGHSDAFGGEYLELVPHERIRHTDTFDDPNLPGQMVTTIGGVRWDRDEYRAGRYSRSHSPGGLLSGLAGIARAARQARRGRDSGSIAAVLNISPCEALRSINTGAIKTRRGHVGRHKTRTRTCWNSDQVVSTATSEG